MVNRDSPRGLIPTRHLNGNPYNGAVREYGIASGTTSGIFTGDPLTLTAAGVVEQAAGTDQLIGVFTGCMFVDANGTPVWSRTYPASTTNSGIAYVVDDPDVIFEIQDDGTSTGAAESDIGALFDLASAAGDTLTGNSTYELDVSSVEQASGVVRLIGFVQRPNLVLGSGNVDCEVIINTANHMMTATAGI